MSFAETDTAYAIPAGFLLHTSDRKRLATPSVGWLSANDSECHCYLFKKFHLETRMAKSNHLCMLFLVTQTTKLGLITGRGRAAKHTYLHFCRVHGEKFFISLDIVLVSFQRTLFFFNSRTPKKNSFCSCKKTWIFISRSFRRKKFIIKYNTD